MSAVRQEVGYPFSIELNDAAGILRVNNLAPWNVFGANAYAIQFTAAMKVHRERFGRVRLLLGNWDVEEETAEVRPVLVALEKLFDSQDRIAMVTQSNSRKAVLRQRPHPGVIRGFLSQSAAETWLLSGD